MLKTEYSWKTLTQEKLDWAYDQGQHAPNMTQLLDKFKIDSALIRETTGDPLRYPYGVTEDEFVDVYVPANSNGNAIIFMHGGAWRTGFAKNYSFLANSFVKQGYTVFIPDFSNAIQLNGNLSTMADQACRSIEWSLKNCKKFNIDKVYLIGHSSGAHLSAVYASNFREYCSNNVAIERMFLFSGLYDLEPVMVSSRQSYLKLSEADVTDLSPIKHLEKISIPVDIICGSLDSPEFIRQSEEFFKELENKNANTRFMCVNNTNHFELLEKINDLFNEIIKSNK